MFSPQEKYRRFFGCVLTLVWPLVVLVGVCGCGHKEQPTGTNSETPAGIELKIETASSELPQTESKKVIRRENGTPTDAGTKAKPLTDTDREAIVRLESFGAKVNFISVDAWIRETNERSKLPLGSGQKTKLPTPSKTNDLPGGAARGNDLLVVLGDHFTDKGLITDQVWVHLTRLNNLKGLTLFLDSTISDAGLNQLKTLTNLEILTLVASQITDAGLEHLMSLTNLRKLDLLFLNMQITDAGLAHLKGLSKLESLSIMGNVKFNNEGFKYSQITDAGLEHLKGLHDLKVLELTLLQVTDAGVNELRKALPNCEIVKSGLDDDSSHRLALYQLRSIKWWWLTPAMQAGVVDQLWTFEDLFDAVMG